MSSHFLLISMLYSSSGVCGLKPRLMGRLPNQSLYVSAVCSNTVLGSVMIWVILLASSLLTTLFIRIVWGLVLFPI